MALGMTNTTEFVGMKEDIEATLAGSHQLTGSGSENQLLVENWVTIVSSKPKIDLENLYLLLDEDLRSTWDRNKMVKMRVFEGLIGLQNLEDQVTNSVIDSELGGKGVKIRLQELMVHYKYHDDQFETQWIQKIDQEVRNRSMWSILAPWVPRPLAPFIKFKDWAHGSLESRKRMQKGLVKHLEDLHLVLLDLNFSKEKEFELQRLLQNQKKPKTSVLSEDEEIQDRLERLQGEESLHHYILRQKMVVLDELKNSLLGKTFKGFKEHGGKIIEGYPSRVLGSSDFSDDDTYQSDFDRKLSENRKFLESANFKELNPSGHWQMLYSQMHKMEYQDYAEYYLTLGEIEENKKVKSVIQERFEGSQDLKNTYEKLNTISFLLDYKEMQIFKSALQDAKNWLSAVPESLLLEKLVSCGIVIRYNQLTEVELKILGRAVKDQFWTKLTEPEQALFSLQNLKSKNNDLTRAQQLESQLERQVLSIKERWSAVGILERQKLPSEEEWCADVLNKAEDREFPLSHNKRQMKTGWDSKFHDFHWPKGQSEIFLIQSLSNKFRNMVSNKVGNRKLHLEDMIRLLHLTNIFITELQITLLIFKMNRFETDRLFKYCLQVHQGDIPHFDTFVSEIQHIVLQAQLRLEVSINPLHLDILGKHLQDAKNQDQIWTAHLINTVKSNQFLHDLSSKLHIEYHGTIVNKPEIPL